MPAEWEPHEATWLSWPHKSASWPGIIDRIPPIWAAMVKALRSGEQVRILARDAALESSARRLLRKSNALSKNVRFFRTRTDDAWIRDHGPIFLTRSTFDVRRPPGRGKCRERTGVRSGRSTAVVDWIYNCWGGKYRPFRHDDAIPKKIAKWFGVPLFEPGIVLEGGSIEVNGRGCLLTTEQCLLNRNRNPNLKRWEIESYLREYLGVEKVLWLGEGIVGDDTDGHIDDIARFVNSRTILCAWENDPSDENHKPLAENFRRLRKMKDAEGRPFQIVSIPMPDPVLYRGQKLPASYANFYIGNKAVLVPTFGHGGSVPEATKADRRSAATPGGGCETPKDAEALKTIGKFFPGRRIVAISSRDLVWGLGACHCVTQQQPAMDGAAPRSSRRA